MTLVCPGIVRAKKWTSARLLAQAPSAVAAVAATRTVVAQFRPGAFKFSGSPIRVMLLHTNITNSNISKMYIGLASTVAAKPWDFAAAPLQVFFNNGQPNVAYGGSIAKYSDAIPMDLPIDKALNIAYEIPTNNLTTTHTGSLNTPAPAVAASLFSQWNKFSVLEAALTTKGTGYTASTPIVGVRGIEASI